MYSQQPFSNDLYRELRINLNEKLFHLNQYALISAYFKSNELMNIDNEIFQEINTI